LSKHKERFDPGPGIYYFRKLAPTEFFKYEQLPWLDQREAATNWISVLNSKSNCSGEASGLCSADLFRNHPWQQRPMAMPSSAPT